MQKRYVGIIGAAQSGKDTLAEYLISEFGFKLPYLAYPIKQVAIDYYGATIHDVYSGEGKASDHHYLKHENGEPISWRYLLEQIGDKLQEIDPLVLLRFVDKQVDHPYLVVPDLRTEPQAQWIRSRGGIIVYVKRDEAEARAWKEMEGPEAHHTKVFFANTKYDIMINNNGTISEFRERIRERLHHVVASWMLYSTPKKKKLFDY